MEIKVSKKKQEMRQDPFFDFLNYAKKFVEGNTNTLIAVGVGLCVVLGGVWVYNFLNKSAEQKAQESFGKAITAYAAGDISTATTGFKSVTENNKNSSQATYSAFILGTIFLKEGKYDEAITWLKLASSKKIGTGFVGCEAIELLADSYESKGDRENALLCLKQALSEDNIRYRFPAIAWKAALISKDMGKFDDAKTYCEKIIADTISQAAALKPKAENFLTEISILAKP